MLFPLLLIRLVCENLDHLQSMRPKSTQKAQRTDTGSILAARPNLTSSFFLSSLKLDVSILPVVCLLRPLFCARLRAKIGYYFEVPFSVINRHRELVGLSP